VLPSSYTIPGSVTVTTGIQNVVDALKTYGCFLVDQGETDGFAIDLDSTDPNGMWETAGLQTTGKLNFLTGADFRRVRDDSQTEVSCLRGNSDPDNAGPPQGDVMKTWGDQTC
jgi:hypothetical protein